LQEVVKKEVFNFDESALFLEPLHCFLNKFLLPVSPCDKQRMALIVASERSYVRSTPMRQFWKSYLLGKGDILVIDLIGLFLCLVEEKFSSRDVAVASSGSILAEMR